MKNRNSSKISREIHPDIYRITLPLFVEKPGPVNIYLFIGDNITLLDVGPSMTIKRLRKGLREHKITFSDIDQIVLTHGHFDHYGAVNKIVDESGGKTRVAIHHEDVVWIEKGFDAPLKIYADFYKLTGIPYFFRQAMHSMDITYRTFVKPLSADLVLNDGDGLTMGNYHGNVVSTPGHSKGSICIHLEEDSILFSGDTVLAHITPNPLAMLEKNSSLPLRSSQSEFYKSLAKLEVLSPSRVYPAHGKPIENLKETLDMYKRNYSKRQELILSIIATKKLTVYQIAKKLFPEIGILRLPMEIYPMVSEVYTHLQVLQIEDKVTCETENGVMRAATC